MSNLPTEEKKIPAPMITIILVLLIAVAIIGFLTAKKHFIREPTVDPVQSEIDTYTQMVNASPQDPEIRTALAYAYQKAERFDEAKSQYLQVLNVDEKYMAAIYNMGMIAKMEEDYKAAEDYFLKVIKLKSDHILGILGLGEAYIAQGKYDEAIKTIDSVLGRYSNIINLHLVKAQALEKKGDLKTAKEEYQAVLKFVPNHKEAKEALEKLK